MLFPFLFLVGGAALFALLFFISIRFWSAAGFLSWVALPLLLSFWVVLLSPLLLLGGLLGGTHYPSTFSLW